MKKSIGVLALIVALGAGGYYVYAKNASAPRVLPKGTEVDLVLLSPLQSGREAKGDPVFFLVNQDVRGPGGELLIPKGTKASGRVEWSRGENMLSSLSNTPARLTVDLDSVAPSGSAPLAISAAQDSDKTYSFDRGNTGKSAVQEKIDGLLQKPETRELLDKLSQAMNGQSVPNLDDPDNKKALQEIAKELSLNSLTEALATDAKPLTSAITGLTSGKLADGLSLGTTFAALELISNLDDIGTRLGRALQGRTIRAYPGTVIKAYTSVEGQLRPQ